MAFLRVVAVFATFLVASSNSFPRNYASIKRFQDDCICMEDNSHTTDNLGNIVSGTYSYLDPLGSLVTVTYTNGIDGYQEKRRIQKNYGQVTVTEVVTDVLEDLQREVLSSIELVLTGPVSETTQTSTIVSRIVSRLRPTIVRAARTSLQKHRGVVDETEVQEVVDQILLELVPFITARVDQHRGRQVTTIVSTTSTNPDELVATIITRLKVIIEQIIEDTYRNKPVTTVTTVDTGDDLVAKILAQLKPVIVTTVRSELNTKQPTVVGGGEVVTITTTKEEFSVDLITDLVGQLQDTIQATVHEVIVNYNGVIGNGEVLVSEIVSKLQPNIRAVISSTVERRGLSYTPQQINRLNRRVTDGLRPVIRQTIEAFRLQQQQTQETVVLSQLFVNEVANDVSAEVDGAVRRQSGTHLRRSFQQQVERVLQTLRPSIRRSVARRLSRRNVHVNGQTFYSTTTYNTLSSRVLSSLRPVVEAAVRTQRQIEQENLLEQQVLEVTFLDGVARNLESEIRTIVTEVISVSGIGVSDASVVDQVMTRLGPVIRRAVEQQLRTRNVAVDTTTFFSSPTYQTLVDTILRRIRVVITQVVEEYRRADLERVVLSQDVVNQAVDELRWVIESTVENEAAANDNDNAVVRTTLSAVRPSVETAVRSVLERNQGIVVSESFYTTATYRTLVERILDDVRIVIEQELSVVRSRQANAGIVVDEVVTEVTPQVRGVVRSVLVSSDYVSDAQVVDLVNSELSSIVTRLVTSRLDHGTSSITVTSLVNQVLARLRPVILNHVRVLRTEVIQDSRSALVQSISARISPTVRAIANTVVSSSYPSGATVEVMVQEVIALLRPAVYAQIEAAASSHSWLSSQAAQDELYALVVAQLRTLVESEVRILVSSYTTTTTVVTENNANIKSIFGVGGVNSVKVHTPEYNYAYMTDK